MTFETGGVLLVAVVKHAEDKRPAAQQPPRLGAGSLRASDHQDAPTGPGMCPTPQRIVLKETVSREFGLPQLFSIN